MNLIASLLAETLTHPPCGQDLSYDADFLALESAAKGKPEQQFGETVIAPESPDWRDVDHRAQALLTRTKDLRVGNLLCRAWTSLQGLQGAADGIDLIAGLVEIHWPMLHPLPEEGDHFMRLNALAFLNDAGGFLLHLRQTPLVRTAAGTVLMKDAEALAKGLPLSTTLSGEQIRMGVAKAWAQGDENLQAVARVSSAIGRIADTCAQHLPENQRPALDGIKSLVKAVTEVLPRPANANAEMTAPVPPLASASENSPLVLVAAANAPKQIRTRDDAIAQLLHVAAFLEASEPTNPAPLLIRRAVRLMQMGFIDIVRELSPESIAQIENIIGTKTEN
jgi:type VI secretion system protein ImpA